MKDEILEKRLKNDGGTDDMREMRKIIKISNSEYKSKKSI